MKLRWVSIQGYRSIRDIKLDIDDFMVFVGQNNHGKSNIFYAIDLFLSSGTRLITSDMLFQCSSESSCNEVVIEAKFDELSHAEIDKLGPWTVEGKLTVSKKYSFDADNKSQPPVYEAVMKVPKEPWLHEDFQDYKNKNIISELPITEFIPPSGQITKEIYKNAIKEYLEKYSEITEWIIEKRPNPAGFNKVLDGYLPEFHLIPAVCDANDEIKSSGNAILSQILGVIIARIASKNPVFQNLQERIQEIKKLIEGETPEQKLTEIREFEERLKVELSQWEVDPSIVIDPPEIEKLFELGTNLRLNDGIETSVNRKGHGLQRSLIMALIRILASETKQSEITENEEQRQRCHIFAFEEPEIYLHPQMCKATYESLKQIAVTDQVMICTHSPHFIDIEDYRHIVIVRKPNLEDGTKTHSIQDELFVDEEKKHFNMIQFFNPDRNELFFARKVVLVEGPTEKTILPLLAKRLECFDHSVSIINCEGKFNIVLYEHVLNAFDIFYVPIYDEDPIPPELEKGDNPKKLREARHAFNENQNIIEVAKVSLCETIEIKGRMEVLLGVSNSQAEKLGKPRAAVEKYSKEETEISEELERIVREAYK